MWYLLQIFIIGSLVYLYRTDISPETPLGYIFLFATIVAYLTTGFLTWIIDLLLRGLALAETFRKVLIARWTTTQR